MTGVLSKIASEQKFLSIECILYYSGVILILFVYAILWQQVIKGMPLVTAYSNKAITVIWGIIFGAVIFGEEITIFNIIGAVIIIIGVMVMFSDEEEKDIW